MAHLDTLIAMVPDEKLRGELQRQITRLTAKTSFGLVFEEHRPENVRLPEFEVVRGGKVVYKDGSTPGIWTVLRVTGDVATVVRTGDTTERAEAAIEDLAVIREFGDPIYPGLQSLGSVEHGGDKPFHTVINAENFHAAEMLLYPYEGKVDAIYLDPPYNTGNKDWKYNNDYVDDEDIYRHSKWLAFMERRLKIAKRLLKRDGAIVVTIDEHEVHRLGMLLEQVFSEFSRQMVTIVNNPKGVTQGNLSRVEEYAIFCFGPDHKVFSGEDDLLNHRDGETDDEGVARPRWKGLLRSGDDAARADRKDMFYPVWIDPKRGKIVKAGEALALDEEPDFDLTDGDLRVVWPVRKDLSQGRWGVGPATLNQLIASGYVALGRLDKKRNSWGITYLSKTLRDDLELGLLEVRSVNEVTGVADVAYVNEATRRTRTVWHRSSHDAGAHGTDLIGNLLGDGRKFPFPKSLYAVEDTLRLMVGGKKDALVLDFFSGSGTTGHAVMRLNRQDGGRRRSILVTNNEVSSAKREELLLAGYQPGKPEWEAQGIFEFITKPRIRAAVTGNDVTGAPIKGDYKFTDQFPISDGFEENVEFFKLTYEDNQLVRLGRKFSAIAPILWMRAGAEGERIDELPEAGWSVPKKAFYGVLTDIDQWEPFVDAVNARDDIRCVYIVTDSQAEFEAINVQIGQGIDSVRLYSDYLQSFEINTRQG